MSDNSTFNSTADSTGESATAAEPVSSWSSFVVLFVFITVAYQILRWIQRRLQYIDLPKLAPGQWDPLVANYNWSGTESNKFKDEFNKLREDSSASATALAQCLMKRAMNDVQQMIEMNEQKSTLQALVKNGSIGEEVWQRFLKAEQLLGEECASVVENAELLRAGWGNEILQQAGKMLALERQRQMEAERVRMEEEMRAQENWSQQQIGVDFKKREEEARLAAEELIRQEEAEKQRKGQSSSNSKKKK